MIRLSNRQTEVRMSKEEQRKALDAAFWLTASPHEHEWTLEQQRLMAQFCLWSTQRLAAVRSASDPDFVLGHSEPEDPSFVERDAK